MSQQNAIRFLRELDAHEELRQNLYECDGREALFAKLAEAGYGFTGIEFEEIVDHLHVQCQSYEEANILMEKATWFRMVSANA